MFRRLFKVILQLTVLVALIVGGTAAWLIYDGLTDQGDRAEIAVVPGSSVEKGGTPGPTLRARLDGAAERYRQGHFPLIFVSGASRPGGYDEAASMAAYLEAHGVSSDAIIKDNQGYNTRATAKNLARYMKWRDFHSVMIVTSYYHVTRTKMALKDAGITDVSQSHVGVPQKEDAYSIAREVAAFYDYWIRDELIPGAQVVGAEIKKDAPKVEDELKKDSEKAKDTVNQKLDNLPK